MAKEGLQFGDEGEEQKETLENFKEEYKGTDIMAVGDSVVR